MLVQPSTPVLGRPPLSPPKKRLPVKDIYEIYARIKDATPARGGRKSVTAQLAAATGVPDWEWTRMKLVYEGHLEGDEFATELVEKIDSGDVTPSGAYRLLNEQREDDDFGAATVKLKDLLGKTIGTQSYYRTIAAAVRASAKVNRGDMSDADVAELIHMIRATGAGMTRLAKLLSAATAEGTSANGQSRRRN